MLQEQVGKMHKNVQTMQKKNQQLLDQVAEYQREIDYEKKQNEFLKKGENRVKSVENKYLQESERNKQLKEDLENMRAKMLEAITAKNDVEQNNLTMKIQVKEAN